jgi:hypothetical protein
MTMEQALLKPGTWVADEDGDVMRVQSVEGRLMRFVLWNETMIWAYSSSKDGFVEIPPMPDEASLETQGYRLTGMAARIDGTQQLADGETWVSFDGSYAVELLKTALGDTNWRWLVERIEEPDATSSDDECPTCKDLLVLVCAIEVDPESRFNQ